MAFERKSMESIVSKMISWTRGVSTQLTDFRVGSKIRALYEAVAVLVEEQYDKMYRAVKGLIESNIYAVIGFDKIPATYATGLATFSRGTPADQNYLIQAGTGLTSQATQFTPPLKFYTTKDAIIAIGSTTVDVIVVCEQSGTIGNILGGTLTTFVQKPIGVDSVTNLDTFNTGYEAETSVEQKARFQKFMQAQARGVLQAIEYGAKPAVVIDPATGLVLEKVVQAIATEDLPDRKGEVDLYVWNGVGDISSDLESSINKILVGYYDTNGNPVYGFKPAGIMVNIYSALRKYVTIKLVITPEEWATLDDLKPVIENEIAQYFQYLKRGQTAVQTVLEANIEFIDGVSDVKLYFSLDSGTTWIMDNLSVSINEVLAVQNPVVYE